MTEAATAADELHGLVDVCIDRPLLSLDRPFTYRVPEDISGLGIGSMVKVPFHRKKVKGWVLGPTPEGERPSRVLSITEVAGPIRWFDEDLLASFRAIAARFVTPLATVIDRATPARVVSEEERAQVPPVPVPPGPSGGRLVGYEGGSALIEALTRGDPLIRVVQPAPEDEPFLPVEAVAACLESGRYALVLIPEAEPLPATAAAIIERFGESAVAYLGGTNRARYRMWMDIQRGRYRCVVGTRPAAFAQVPDLGLVWVQREAHPGHRDERSPSFHVRDIAIERARASGASVVLAGRCVSVETAANGYAVVEPARRAWPPVEVVAPVSEGRAPRLVAALKSARSAFLFEPRRGYGIAVVCRACGTLAACGSCGGLLRVEGGDVRCIVCESSAVCTSCGKREFGLRKGGRERVEEWVEHLPEASPVLAGAPKPGWVAVGSAPDVRDITPPALDLVGILDADQLLARTGLNAKERALATWMEAAGWARPTGRVIVQTRFPNSPVIQSLVAGTPNRFHRAEMADRQAAGFPVGSPVFRVTGTARAFGSIQELAPITMLEGGRSAEGHGVCLVALRPETLASFDALMRRSARDGDVIRVDAEPHL